MILFPMEIYGRWLYFRVYWLKWCSGPGIKGNRAKKSREEISLNIFLTTLESEDELTLWLMHRVQEDWDWVWGWWQRNFYIHLVPYIGIIKHQNGYGIHEWEPISWVCFLSLRRMCQWSSSPAGWVNFQSEELWTNGYPHTSWNG